MIGTMTGEHKIVTSLVWLTPEIIAAGTSADQLLFIESGDPKHNFCASTVETLDLEKAKDKYITTRDKTLFQLRINFY